MARFEVSLKPRFMEHYEQETIQIIYHLFKATRYRNAGGFTSGN